MQVVKLYKSSNSNKIVAGTCFVLIAFKFLNKDFANILFTMFKTKLKNFVLLISFFFI